MGVFFVNRILKNVYVIFATLVLILGAALVATKEPSAPPCFRIQNEFGQQDISIFDAQDGNYYVFLPSYADLKQVQAIIPRGCDFYLDDIRLTDQMTCEIFELEKPYDFSLDGQDAAALWFYQSQNVATMYIDTVSGEMTDIHNDKDYEEYASMTLYSPDGQLNHFDGSSRLKARGNATFTCDKCPYLLKLSSDGDLLGMGSAQKWVLLANAYDETNLNNKLVFDLASQVGCSWSPDSQFVDLYLNGEFSGLYLLTEKVEVHPNRLDLDAASGEFLCKVELFDRREMLKTYFESSMERIIEICYPEEPSVSNFEYQTYLVNLMERAFCSETDLIDSEIVDLDSWVRRYLIDEISGNIDSDVTSSYFYFSDGKFFAGPVWDYDMAFGNHYRNQEPFSFIAKNEKKTTYCSSLYYSSLFDNESFYQRMVEIYRTEFVPILQEMIHHGIDDQLDLIRAAAQMNSIRWRHMFDELINNTAGTGIVRNADELKDWFTRRIQFLDSAWLENKTYCTVQFLPGAEGAFWNISVEKGSHLETTYMDLINTSWIEIQTGEPVDFQSPITQDLTVTLKIPEELSEEDTSNEELSAVAETPAVLEEEFSDEGKKENEQLLCGTIFLTMFVCMLLADGYRRRREKSYK